MTGTEDPASWPTVGEMYHVTLLSGVKLYAAELTDVVWSSQGDPISLRFHLTAEDGLIGRAPNLPMPEGDEILVPWIGTVLEHRRRGL